MSPALDGRTAPDTASGAVLFRRTSPIPVPTLRERDFWRAVAGTVVATLRAWPR